MMYSKPALKVLFPFIIGIFLGRFLHLSLFFSFFIILVLIIINIFLYKKNFNGSVFVFILLIFLGFLDIQLNNDRIVKYNRMFSNLFNRKVELIGWICDRKDYYNEKTHFVIVPILIKANNKIVRIKGKILIIRDTKRDFSDYGDVIRADGMIIAPRIERIPGGFNYKQYLNRRGIFAILKQKKSDTFIVRRGNKGNFFERQIIKPIKLYLVDRISERFNPEEAEILKGVMIGEREGINPEIKEAFIKSGVIHILAVSGLHVGFVIGFLVFIGKILHLKRKFLFILIIPGLLFYIVLTGARSPVIRASLMAFIIFMSYIIQRKSDFYNSLCAAGFFI
ncbi:hypothetical protein DRQ09_06695, partial [candidate division KSB1 bacterium]